MKSSRRLALRRETLTELTVAELSFAGAALEGPPLTIKVTCSLDDVNAWAREAMLELTLNQHCSWSCI